MKILHLVTRRQRRGAEVFAAQLADGLVQEGHEVQLVGLYAPPADPLVPLLAPVHDLTGREEDKLSYSLISEIADFTKAFAPDVVQANGSSTLKYASLAKTLSGGRWPLVYRNISIASQWLRGPAHRFFGQLMVRNVDHVAAVSRLSEEDFRITYRVPPERISTIPIGVHIPPQPQLPGLRDRLAGVSGVSPDSELLLHVGSFSPEKNHVWLLDAFTRILVRRPAAHLILVGDGALFDAVEAQVADRGLQQRVHLLGSRADVPTLIGGADLFLLPSTIEGIPGVVLEAAAQAVPTVATDVGSVSEAVDDGRTGILVPLGDKECFTAAVCSLMASPAQRRAMGAAAYKLVSDNYSMAGIVSRFERLYGHLCNRDPVKPESSGESLRAWI
jgi:glycosyltransferase involved in cell wall biosynthesis